MTAILIKTLQFLLCLSLLIVLHEGGHFGFAKLFKVRVEKFFMFFDYKFHLFSTRDKWFARLFPRIAKNETEYGIGWIPLGGYVKISGMIDESLDLEQMKQPVEKWEFRAKPVWQRFLVMVGGVLVNFLLALFIYAMILFAWGEDTLPIRNIKYGFSYNAMAEGIGFRDGDVPLRADNEPIDVWNGTVFRTISQAHTVTVRRGGAELLLTMPDEGINLLEMLEQEPRFLSVNVPAVIDSVLPGSPAYLAGIRKGDRITSVEGQAIAWWSDFDDIMGRKSDILAAGCSHADSVRLRQLTLTVAHAGNDTMSMPASTDSVRTGANGKDITITLDADYHLGIMKAHYLTYYTLEHRDYGFWESIPAGITYGWETLKGYVSDLQYVFSKKGAQSVGSFGTIGNLFPAVWDWQSFWQITAFISLMLAFMNILPIPGLDGGHIFFLLVEAVTRRPPSEKFMERAQYVGMAIILALMALAIFNDIVKFVF